jgi:mono/diheme cytochrome c family protein
MSRFRALGLLLFGVACSRAPDDLREWRVSDHDHTTNPGAQQVVAQPSSQPASMHGIDEVTLIAWKQKCVTCHGMFGRGDGPQGPMVRATDLSRPDWQAQRSDSQLSATIRGGRGAMPAFDLPASTIDGLVRLIRLLDASRAARGADGGTADGGAHARAAGGTDAGPMMAPSAHSGSSLKPAPSSKPPSSAKPASVTRPPGSAK